MSQDCEDNGQIERFAFDVNCTMFVVLAKTKNLFNNIKKRINELWLDSKFVDIDPDKFDCVAKSCGVVIIIDEEEVPVTPEILANVKNRVVVIFSKAMGLGLTPLELDELHPCAHKCLNIGKLVAIIVGSTW